jgi:hypothetical protein
MSKPDLIVIEHDDYHAKHIGLLKDGRHFFLTTPFIPATVGNAGKEFVALFLFDKHGQLVEAHIDDLGTRAELDKQRAISIYEQRLAELGEVDFCRIEIKPFEVERFGTTFGLVPRPPEEEDDVWAVEMQPGNYMAFFEPWDSGDYDT